MSYQTIAMKCLPRGWKVQYRRSLSGRCYFATRTIATPKPTTLRSLHIFLHECGHAWLHGVPGATRHREEYEAETWAFKKMREAGLEPDPRSIDRAKAYVRRKIDQALARKAKKIDQEAIEWSGWEPNAPH